MNSYARRRVTAAVDYELRKTINEIVPIHAKEIGELVNDFIDEFILAGSNVSDIIATKEEVLDHMWRKSRNGNGFYGYTEIPFFREEFMRRRRLSDSTVKLFRDILIDLAKSYYNKYRREVFTDWDYGTRWGQPEISLTVNINGYVANGESKLRFLFATDLIQVMFDE